VEKNYALVELNPCVLEAGFQGTDSWSRHPRRTYDHALMYCYGRPANLKIEERGYTLKRGDLAILRPDTPHLFWVEDDQPAEIIWVHFDLEYRDDAGWLLNCYNTAKSYAGLFSGQLAHPEHIRPQALINGHFRLPDVVALPSPDEAEVLLRTLVSSYLRNNPLWELHAKAILLRILAWVFTACVENKQQEGWKKQLCYAVKCYISTYYYKKLTVANIAAAVYLSPDYCGRIFRQETGMTVIEYVHRVRIKRAQQLLMDHSLSIEDIARRVGFQRTNYFCGIAKKLTGKTPGQLRRDMLSAQ
jgi:AraC-like DNA-binding protein